MVKRIFITFIYFVISAQMFNVIFATDIKTTNKVETVETNKDPNIVLDSVYYDWYVYYTLDKEEEKKCYIATFATEQKGNYTAKRKPYIMVSTYNATNIEEISVNCGYRFKIKSSIYLGIDNQQFRLLTNDDMAWATTRQEDKIIIEALMGSDTVKVKGETIDGKYTIDYYSVKGLARAYKKMKELCGGRIF